MDGTAQTSRPSSSARHKSIKLGFKAMKVSDLFQVLLYKYSSYTKNNKRKLKNPSESLKKCYEFLKLTSRSFYAVILNLDIESQIPVAIFYLVLRGLDTIEDDMTLPIDLKTDALTNFADHLDVDGWNFQESGENEKDRELLVHFHFVIEEYKKLHPKYKNVIKNMTVSMAEGMIYYLERTRINTLEEWDDYCYYVAGLVGLGLSQLFARSGLEDPNNPIYSLGKYRFKIYYPEEACSAIHGSGSNDDALQPFAETHNENWKKENLGINLGLFLQKTNIIRDYLEDALETRNFWPREVWAQYAAKVEDYIYVFHQPRRQKEHLGQPATSESIKNNDNKIEFGLIINQLCLRPDFLQIIQAFASSTCDETPAFTYEFDSPQAFFQHHGVTCTEPELLLEKINQMQLDYPYILYDLDKSSCKIKRVAYDCVELGRRAVSNLNDVIINAVYYHTKHIVKYLSQIKNQTIFEFCAIPQVMAICTLLECYNNPLVFVSNVKVSKLVAVRLLNTCNNIGLVLGIFFDCLSELEKRILANTFLPCKTSPVARATGYLYQSDSATFLCSQHEDQGHQTSSYLSTHLSIVRSLKVYLSQYYLESIVPQLSPEDLLCKEELTSSSSDSLGDLEDPVWVGDRLADLRTRRAPVHQRLGAGLVDALTHHSGGVAMTAALAATAYLTYKHASRC